MWASSAVGLISALFAASSAQGAGPELLIAAPQSTDADFGRSVILLIHNAGDGAVGFMLNRPTRAGLGDLFPGLKQAATPIYAGGPINIGVNALVRSRGKPAGGVNLFADVWLIANRQEIRKLAAAPPPGFRIFLGQCGWNAAQLTDEFRRGLWIAAPPDASAVFDPSPETLWMRLIAKRTRAK